jgi:hypothetical protein
VGDVGRTVMSLCHYRIADNKSLPLQDFLAEFKERPWLTTPQAEWDSERSLLLVTIEIEGDDPKLESEGVFDEVWDCVAAYFNFTSEKISFDILEAKLIS